MKKWKERFLKSRFDRKMQMVLTAAIIITTVLSMLVTVISSVTSMKEQSIELLQIQNKTIQENFRDALENYRTLAYAVVLDNSVQEYVKAQNVTRVEAAMYEQNALSLLDSINNMYPNLNFIALVKNDTQDYLFRGKDAITTTGFLQCYRKDEQSCKSVRRGTLKMGLSNTFYTGKKYSLSVYFPIYDTGRIFAEHGLLCMNIQDTSLDQIIEADAGSMMKTIVLDTEGMLVASGETERIGSYVDYTEEIQGRSGSFVRDGELYIYNKVQDWNYYVVGSVPYMMIYESSFRSVVVMLFVVVLILLIGTKVIREIIQVVYYPLDKVVKKMDAVSSGSLTTRINMENMGEDFTKLAVGFNSMMDEIQELLEQVKLEQHQIEQIRFNALQSQIKPHFLYNTLECIHWQAMADGNQEVSTMVKALAKYYRICLSGGKDIIPIHMELEHIRNYLIIQNMRYDNIIESEFDIDDSVTDSMIPKLTLQPLVENSIYHGLKIKEGKKGTLYVSVKRIQEEIQILVSDTGTGMEQEKIEEMNQLLAQYDDSFGYGVRNVNKRIQLLYGIRYGLHFQKNAAGGGITVVIRLPYSIETQ